MEDLTIMHVSSTTIFKIKKSGNLEETPVKISTVRLNSKSSGRTDIRQSGKLHSKARHT